MKKRTNSSSVLSVIAVITSLLVLVAFAFVVFLAKGAELSFNGVTLVLSVFSLITALLIGMQIWNVFQFDRKFDAMRHSCQEEMEKTKEAILEANRTELIKTKFGAIGTVLMQFGWSFEDKKEYDDAFRSYINALRALQQADLSDADIQECYDEVVNRLLIIASELSPEEWSVVNVDEKNVYIDTILKIPNKEMMNKLLEFVYKISIKDPPLGYQGRPLSPQDRTL